MQRCKTMLFMPGNNPGMLVSAGCLGADIVIFDLEDAVAGTEKDAARILVRHALMETRPQGTGTAVRINALDTPYWQEDVKAVVRAEPDIILIPKADGAEYVEGELDKLGIRKKGLPRPMRTRLRKRTGAIRNGSTRVWSIRRA
jgi:citrate lyase subunit beta/citryl-CoA lyase